MFANITEMCCDRCTAQALESGPALNWYLVEEEGEDVKMRFTESTPS